MILEILFLTLSKVDIQFAKKKLIWRFYTAAKALLTTKKMELINEKKFDKTALDKNFETFMVYVVALEAPLSGVSIYPDKPT